ncbi:MAG: glycerate kinase, partial [Dehalococcoidia bacterium]
LDAQTAYGKTALGVARVAKECGVPAVVAVVGGLGQGWRGALGQGVDAIVTIVPRPMPLAETMASAAGLLTDASEQALRLVMVGQSLP